MRAAAGRTALRAALRGRVATLRARLLLVAVLLLLVGLVVSDAVVLASLRGHLVDRVDSQVRTIALVSARLPLPLPATGTSPRALPGAGPALLSNLDLIDAFALELVGPDGRPLGGVRVPGGPGGPSLPDLDTATVARRAATPFSVDDTAGGSRWRVLAVPYLGSTVALPGLQPGATGAATPAGASVVVAASERGVEAAQDRLTSLCLMTGAALLAALGVAGWYAIRSQLRPLRRIETTAAAIAAGDLTRRVEAGGHPATEVGRLTVALNGMLAQLETAFAARTLANRRMRDFVADVSHELRTPLFAIHGSAQLYRMGALADPAELERTMHRIESESARLARLATDLLLLARLDAESGADAGDVVAALDPAPMDLRTLAAEARADVRALDPAREVRVTGPDGGEPGSAPVLGDEARLRQVAVNLVGNAVIHTPAGTPLRIGVGTVAGAAVWEIEDAGPGLLPQDVERIFDPFYRVDSSRSRAGGAGAGLGLAIVRALVTAHGGRVTVRSAPGAGTTMRVELPLLVEPPLLPDPADDPADDPA